MTTMFKSILIVCCFALPSTVFAADNATELKAASPQQVTVSAAPVEAIPKPAAAVQTAHIGYVDINRVGKESERGKALTVLLSAKKDMYQEKIDAKKKQLDKLRASIEAKIASLTPEQREAKSKEFQKKVEAFQKFAQASEGDLMALQDKESRALFEAIEQAAVAHGKANGFAAIVIKKELLYVGSSVDAQDVTDPLIKSLNQADQKK